MRAHAIRIHARGGLDAMRYDEIEIPEPGPGEVRIRNTAVGLNFVDPGHRSGLRTEGRYETPLPMILGTEGAGVVEAVGPGVTSHVAGERVAYWYSPPGGAYCTHRNYPVTRLVKLPDHITDEMGAAVLCKGMTADILVNEAYRVKPGDTVLVHAAAGATGLLVVQWAKHLGATVIGTMSTDEKAAVARSYGCDHTIIYTREDFAERVREITGGRGVQVVFEGVGRDTFLKSLDCLAFRGTCALFGLSSGPLEPFDTYLLSSKGCLYLTRPSVHQYLHTAELFLRSADNVFAMIKSGAMKVHIGQRFRLQDVADAHQALEERRTIGSTVMLP
jgi:NADPH2:quinone reductase